MAMFNSYVSLPEGIWSLVSIVTQPSTVTGFHDACYDTYEWGMTISVHWQFMQVLIMAHTVITWVIWGFPEMGVPPNGWFISWKIHLQMDDLGVPLFEETSKSWQISLNQNSQSWIMDIMASSRFRHHCNSGQVAINDPDPLKLQEHCRLVQQVRIPKTDSKPCWGWCPLNVVKPKAWTIRNLTRN